jgi:hypothetical protein
VNRKSPEDMSMNRGLPRPSWCQGGRPYHPAYSRNPCYADAMIHDLITSFLVAFAAVTASEVLTRIWESL